MKLMTGWMVFAGFAVAISGYLIGAGLAAIFRLPLKQIIAVSVETAFQNGQIALILLQTSFQPPFNDVATIAPIAQLTITGMKAKTLFKTSVFLFSLRQGVDRGIKLRWARAPPIFG